MIDQEFFQKCDNLERRIKQLEAIVGKIEAESEPEFERVKYGEKYYHIEMNLEVRVNPLNDTGGRYDKIGFDNNNYFHTEKRAQEVADEIKFLLKLERLHDIYCPDYKPDWETCSSKYYVCYDIRQAKWYPQFARVTKYAVQVYFPTEEIAQKVCDVLNKELE